MGLEMAMEELTLVLFTTIAPSGAVAVALMALLSLCARDEAERARIDQCAWVPLAIALVGLVTSATHLGNPANALYVLLGVGSSPLSNEVACAVVFFGVSGLRWLLSFSRRNLRVVRAVLTLAVAATAAAFVTAVAFAYDAETVPTWHSPYVPASLWLNALCGGSLLALATMRWACPERPFGHVGKAFVVLAVVALAGGAVAYVLQNGVLERSENALARGVDLVPCYPAMIAAYVVLAAVGCALVAVPREFFSDAGAEISEGAAGKKESFAEKEAAVKEPSTPTARSRRFMARPAAFHAKDALGCVLVLGGIFIVRFAFYMMHLTV